MKRISINTDENADWIKRVNGGKSNKQELEIHAELAKKAAEEEARKNADKKARRASWRRTTRWPGS